MVSNFEEFPNWRLRRNSLGLVVIWSLVTNKRGAFPRILFCQWFVTCLIIFRVWHDTWGSCNKRVWVIAGILWSILLSNHIWKVKAHLIASGNWPPRACPLFLGNMRKWSDNFIPLSSLFKVLPKLAPKGFVAIWNVWFLSHYLLPFFCICEWKPKSRFFR